MNKFDTIVTRLVEATTNVQQELIDARLPQSGLDINKLSRAGISEEGEAVIMDKLYSKGAGPLWKWSGNKFNTRNVTANIKPGFGKGEFIIKLRAAGQRKFQYSNSKDWAISISYNIEFNKNGLPKLSKVGTGVWSGPQTNGNGFRDESVNSIKKLISKEATLME